MVNSNLKGKRGERLLSQFLSNLFPNLSFRRGQQYCGSNGDADVVGLPGVHIECKNVESLNLQKALDQAKKDARPGEIPVVCHKKNRRSWKLYCELSDLPKLAKIIDSI